VTKCALCEKENVDLQQSHIIPKLVYTRIKSHPQSRFRNIHNINKIYQDGEKYKMLCHECEKKFSRLETLFSNHFIDKYIITSTIPKINPNNGWLSNYCLSVTWRVLYDDLFRLNSFSDKFERSIFEDFESQLQSHLDEDSISPIKPKLVHNYIFKIEELIKIPEFITFLEKALFGYSYFDLQYNIFMVFTYYAGLVFVTSYSPQNLTILNQPNLFRNLFIPKKLKIKNLLKQEIYRKTNLDAAKYKEEMSDELRTKISKYYSNKS
jgi:hypothetical protein